MPSVEAKTAMGLFFVGAVYFVCSPEYCDTIYSLYLVKSFKLFFLSV